MTGLLLALLLSQDEPKPAVEAGYDGGFYVGGKDVRLTVEGLLQVNARVFTGDSPRESEFELRRFRLEFSGEFFERWLFHIEPKFTEGAVALEEAWVGARFGDHLVMIGRMKEPFSSEEMGSQRHMDMLNFSILNQFVPAEDHGITVFGSFDVLQYQVGIYNGTGGDDTTSDKDVALRLVLHPWRGLQFGGSLTYGRQRTDISGNELRTEARVSWAQYLPGTLIDGERLRFGAEAALLEGPFAATVEFIRISEEINGLTVHFNGGYVQASYVLTGEGRRWKGEPVRLWKGVSPQSPFLAEPGVGAWQLVARWSRLVLDGDLAGFLTAFPGRIDSVTLGINWIANEFVKLKINAFRTFYGQAILVSGTSQAAENAILFQVQVMF